MNFRLVCSDLSWATVHAALETLNSENVYSYMDKIYRVSKNEIEIDSKTSWLASCSAHTMNRFVKLLKKKKLVAEKSIFQFAVYCFSLLLNTVELEATKTVFRLICIVFLRTKKASVFTEALDALKELMDKRTNDKIEIDGIIRKYSSNLLTNATSEPTSDSNEEIEQPSEEVEENDLNELMRDFCSNSKTIKDSSPFARCFREIQAQIKAIDISDEFFDENPFYNESFIDYLLDNHMPYIFIWGSYAFKGLDITRITNGCIENLFKFRKSLFSALYPADYMTRTYDMIMGKFSLK